MLANSQKQLDSLRTWFEYFVREFQKVDLMGDVHFRRPEFFLFRDMKRLVKSQKPWAAVFIDEAHDLPEHAAITLKEACEQLQFYLIAACDRHQRLKLAGSDAKVIPGFNFERKSKRLKQVYRNPAPIYIASLALMFRWFSSNGPKVIPTSKQLEDCFGFSVGILPGQAPRLTIKNDAHPANSWKHTIARFDNPSTAHTLLRREKFRREEVLWVRFSQEDQSFDYEELQKDFTYHNCRTEEAIDINDKYIKGQDYPVVVIEGFPSFMDQYANKSQEDRMWAFRRELYLCSSRSTCFLFLICCVTSSEEINRISEEIDLLIGEVSVPRNDINSGNGTKEWSFILKPTDEKRDMDEYTDAIHTEYTKDSSLKLDQNANLDADFSIIEIEEETLAEFGELDEATILVEDDGIDELSRNNVKNVIIDRVPIEKHYVKWPIPAHLIPNYKWVLIVNSSESVRLYADRLGCSLPQLLDVLKRQGLNYAANTSIPVPIMRSLAFEFECFPANTQQEYDERIVDSECTEDELTQGTTALACNTQLHKVRDTHCDVNISSKMITPLESPIDKEKSQALDLLSSENKKINLGKNKPLGNEFKVKPNLPTISKVLDDLKITDLGNYSLDSSNQNELKAHTDKDASCENLDDEKNTIYMCKPIIVTELAKKLNLRVFMLVRELIALKVFASPNHALTPEIAVKVCKNFGVTLKLQKK